MEHVFIVYTCLLLTVVSLTFLPTGEAIQLCSLLISKILFNQDKYIYLLLLHSMDKDVQ